MGDEEQVVVPKSGANSKLLIVVLATNVLMAGGFGYLVISGRSSHAADKVAAKPKAEKGPPTVGPLVEIGSLVANLRGPEVSHYVKVALHVEATNEETKKRVEAALVPIRNEALTYLSGITLSESMGEGRMHAMAEELKKRVAEIVGKDAVHRVYFSEFVIQ